MKESSEEKVLEINNSRVWNCVRPEQRESLALSLSALAVMWLLSPWSHSCVPPASHLAAFSVRVATLLGPARELSESVQSGLFSFPEKCLYFFSIIIVITFLCVCVRELHMNPKRLITLTHLKTFFFVCVLGGGGNVFLCFKVRYPSVVEASC